MPSKKKNNKSQGNHITNQNINNRYLIFLSIAITFICYIPVFECDFINMDDNKLIYENRIVNQGKHISIAEIFKFQSFKAHYKPLVVLSWNLEYRLWKDNPKPYHVNNLILHLLNTLLVFIIILKLCSLWNIDDKKRIFIAFFTSLFFGIHPMHVESVAWATERKDVLYTFFFMSGMLSYIYYIKKKAYKYMLAASVFYLLSMLSKSPAITLVAVFFLIDLSAGRKINKKSIIEKIPVLLLFVFGLYIYGLLTSFHHQAVGIVGGIAKDAAGSESAKTLEGLPDFYTRILLVGFKFIFWILHILIPVKLSIAYPRKPFLDMVDGGIHLLPWLSLFIVFLAFYYRNKKYIYFGILFFAITILPALSISDKGTGIFLSDRYTYVPSLGIILLLVTGIFSIKSSSKNRNYKLIFLGILALISSIYCNKRVTKWKNSETLFLDVVKKYPYQVPVAYNNLGLYYKDNKQFDKAIKYFKTSTEFSSYYQSFNNLANIYFNQSKYKEAIKYFDKAAEHKPNAAEIYSNKGAAYFRLHEIDSALKYINKALELRKNFIDALQNRASIYGITKQYEKAIKDYDKCIKLLPKNDKLYNIRGFTYNKMKEYKKAIKDFNRAISLNPGVGDYYFNRSLSYFFLEQYKKAYQDLQRGKRAGAKPNPRYVKLLNKRLKHKSEN